MSWEEDFLMRRVGEITNALKGAGMLEECGSCTTLYAAELDECPNCGHPKGEPRPEAMSGERPTPLGVESTAGANALPAETVHGGADPNAVMAQGEDSGEPDAGDDEDTADGTGPEVNDYADRNVEQLKQELSDRNVFYPGSAKRADLVALLQEDDRTRAAETDQV